MVVLRASGPAAASGAWRQFYAKLRADMIEAQCALEAGRLIRASELMDGMLRDAQRAGLRLGGESRGGRRR